MLPEKEHLFKKQLSKHSTGAYIELFREVRSSFEAVLTSGKTATEDRHRDRSVTFSAKIEELERDKLKLTEELLKGKIRADRAEKDLDQLKRAISALRQQDSQKMALISHYKIVTIKCLEEANGALQKFMLSRLDSGVENLGIQLDQGWVDLA